jgi:hypothetical protein
VLRLILLIGLFSVSLIQSSFAIEPLERTPSSSPRLVDFLGNQISENVNIHQQVQVTADLTNNQDITQKFTYIVQIKNNDNVVVHIAWISGSLIANQSFSPALSWTPDSSGPHIAEIFVWESLSNQDALSQPNYIAMTVS